MYTHKRKIRKVLFTYKYMYLLSAYYVLGGVPDARIHWIKALPV